MTEGSQAPILLVMSDLMFRSKLDALARSADRELRVARSSEQLERHVANGAFSFAVVDLECDTLDPATAITKLRETPGGKLLPILAYAGHTNVAALRTGKDAGADRIVARSGTEAEFARWLAAGPPHNELDRSSK